MTTLFHDLDYSDGLSISLKNENASSYGGILSNLNDDKSLNDLSTHEDKKSHKKKKNELQKITIEWDKEEKEVVYVTGSFCSLFSRINFISCLLSSGVSNISG